MKQQQTNFSTCMRRVVFIHNNRPINSMDLTVRAVCVCVCIEYARSNEYANHYFDLRTRVCACAPRLVQSAQTTKSQFTFKTEFFIELAQPTRMNN